MGVFLVMQQDQAFGPLYIGLFGVSGLRFGANDIPPLIQQFFAF
jgi:hypothetical protein